MKNARCTIIVIMMIALLTVGCSKPPKELDLKGIYECQGNPYSYLSLGEDYSCEFGAICLGGIYPIKGIYSIQGNQLVVNLMESDPDGYFVRPEQVAKTQYFTVIDENTLEINNNENYLDDINDEKRPMTRTLSLFVRESN